MWPFLILFSVPIILQHVVSGEYRVDFQRKNQIAITAFFLLLTCLVALRHPDVGSDTRVYIHYYQLDAQASWEILHTFSLEPGYVYLSKFISLFTLEPQIFLAVIAVLTNVMIWPTYHRTCEDATLTMVLFCTMSTFVMMFSGIRQMLAIGVGFICYELTRRRKLLYFLLAVLLASSFHTSAFMLILMYPVYHARVTPKWLIVVVPALILLYSFNQPIFTMLSFLLEQYTKYEGTITSTGAYTMILLFVIFAVFSFVIPDQEKMDEETTGMRNILLLAVALQMFAPLHNLAMRMNYYYIIFIPLLIPRIIARRNHQWAKVAVFARQVMVVFFLIYFFYNANLGYLNVFPYRFFWETVQ